MKLTAKAVEKLRYEGKQPFRDVKDEGAIGLYLRIWASGEKRWAMRYKIAGKVRIGTFGDAMQITLAQAHRKAAEWRALIEQGRDPAGEKQAQDAAERRLPNVCTFAAEYIERHAKPNKRSWREDERLLKREILPAIGDMRIDRVQRRDIVLLLDVIRDRGAPVLANRALAVARRMFAFAIERGVIEASPFVGLKATREKPRERVLTDDEIATLWSATAPGAPRIEPSTRMALRLLLLTGCRASEIADLEWPEVAIEAAELVLPAPRTKNGREHRLPLSAPALEILREAEALRAGPWVLPAMRGAGHVTIWGLIDAMRRIVPGAVVHDIRRTVATGLQKLGIRLEVTEAVLNHASGSRAGVIGIYQRHDWVAEKRVALDGWARHLLHLAGGALADNVVNLATAELHAA